MLESCHSGFEIAEADLRFRGGGQVFGSGTRQSGGLDATDLCQREIALDGSIVEGARRAAEITIEACHGAEGAPSEGGGEAAGGLPVELVSAAAAFRAAVRAQGRSGRGSAVADAEEGEEGEGGEREEQLLGIAV